MKPLPNKAVSRRERDLLAATEATKQRLATVLESISDGFIALDRDWEYTALNKGSLEAFSDGPGRGSEFVMRLPLVDALPKHERVPPSAVPGPAHSRRILLVDDNEAFALAMVSLLNAMGHDVQAIHDGGAAIAIARAQRPQVVLLDINLPGKRGYDIAREIRADPALAGSLLIAVTGYGQEQDKHQALQAGFDHHLTKPVDENVLERLINEALP